MGTVDIGTPADFNDVIIVSQMYLLCCYSKVELNKTQCNPKGASGPGETKACFVQGEKKKRRAREWREGGMAEVAGGAEKGLLSVLNETKRTFFLPPPVVLSNSISLEEQ